MQSGVRLQGGFIQLFSGLLKKHSYSDGQPRLRHLPNQKCTSAEITGRN